MAEEHTLIDDIIKNHTERILNLRKFYPFFSLCASSLQQYKEGAYAHLDMGYLTMAILRYFIHENSFNEKPVSYDGYDKFCRELLKRDYEIEDEELNRYIFDKIRNGGRAFEMSFFDPAERKNKIARVRLIDSVVRDDQVLYTITEDGIEFYLSTKEVKDESRINMDQLLLEKMIKAENFRGGIDVIERINIEVKSIDKQREGVVQLLLTDVKAGTEAMDSYMDRIAVWFAEERKLFTRNRELADKAAARYSAGTDVKITRDITRLETLLKQTIENHSELINKTAELSRFADEMIRRSRTRSLKDTFDFEAMLRRMEQYDRPDVMEEIVMPFLLPIRRKSLSIHTIDNLVLGRLVDTDKGEKKEELKADLDFLYDDEILHNSIEKNFGLLFLELLDRLTRWEKLTLSEYNAILEIRFGKEIYENRDYYSFLTHLAGKEDYMIDRLISSQETFLEDMVFKGIGLDKLRDYKGMGFHISFGDELIKISEDEDGFATEVSDMTFERRSR